MTWRVPAYRCQRLSLPECGRCIVRRYMTWVQVQCRMAAEVANSFLKEICRNGVPRRQSGLKAVERSPHLLDLAIRLATKHGIRVLDAVPHEHFDFPKFVNADGRRSRDTRKVRYGDRKRRPRNVRSQRRSVPRLPPSHGTSSR